MTPNELKVLSLEVRIAKIEARGKNLKCPGVLAHLKRELRTARTV